jgi:periplasmic divalent cation tolerance protein
MTTTRVVLITTPDHETSLRLARGLVEERLAACVNILPGVTSVYVWQGKQCEDSEELLVVKTTRERVPALLEYVARHHPYEVPEGLAVPVESGWGPYLAWVDSSVGSREGQA